MHIIVNSNLLKLDKEDIWLWKNKGTGAFSVRSAYSTTHDNGMVISHIFSLISGVRMLFQRWMRGNFHYGFG